MEDWHEEYRKLMFDPDGKEENLIRAANIKFEHMPEHLYKYRCFSENHISALERDVLYFSNFKDFNDIKDSNLYITDKAEKRFHQQVYDELCIENGLPKAEIDSLETFLSTVDNFFKEQSINKGSHRSIEERQKLDNELKQLLNAQKENFEAYKTDQRNTYSVCCFSATRDNSQMWGLYADSNKGFCIQYDFKALGIDNPYTTYLFPVLYVDDSRVPVDDTEKIDGNINMYAATLKETGWAYEKEWRMLYYLSAAGKPVQMPKPATIYLGERTSKQNIECMKAICRSKSINLYQMHYNQKTNMIEPTLVTL